MRLCERSINIFYLVCSTAAAAAVALKQFDFDFIINEITLLILTHFIRRFNWADQLLS